MSNSWKQKKQLASATNSSAEKGTSDKNKLLRWDSVARRSNHSLWIEKNMTAFMAVCPRLWHHLSKAGHTNEIKTLQTMDQIIDKSTKAKEETVILGHRLKKLATEETEQKSLIVESTKGYAFIWEVLSAESIARLREEANFRQVVEEKKQVWDLLQIIHRTHALAIDPARSTAEQYYQHELRFHNLRQYDTETAQHFATRLEEENIAMTVIWREKQLQVREEETTKIEQTFMKAGVITAEDQQYLDVRRVHDAEFVALAMYKSQEELAVKYLMTLDKKHWGQMLVDLNNDQLKGKDTYPQTLEAAAKLAAGWRVERQKEASKLTALATHVKEQPTVPAKKAECWWCGGNHYQSNCEAKKAGKPKTAPNADSTDTAVAAKAKYCVKCKSREHNTKEHETAAVVGVVLYEEPTETDVPSFALAATLKIKEKPTIHSGNSSINAAAATNDIMRDPLMIILDTGSQLTILKNPHLLNNIRTAHQQVRVVGVSSQESSIKQQGDTKYYGTVWFDPNAVANILGLITAQAHAADIVMNFKKDFRVIFHDGTVHVYNQILPGIYGMDMRDSRNCKKYASLATALVASALTDEATVLSATTTDADLEWADEINDLADKFNEQLVDSWEEAAIAAAAAVDGNFKLQPDTAEDRKAKYSKEQVKKAELARELQNRVFATSADFALGISRNYYADSGIRPEDVHRADDIWGKISIARARGATKTQQAPKHRDTGMEIPDIGKEVEFHIDIFVSCTVSFLIITIQPIGMIMVYVLNNLYGSTIARYLNRAVAKTKNRGFIPLKLYHDNAPNMMILSESSVGVTCDAKGAGAHEEFAERDIQTVKEAIRAIVTDTTRPHLMDRKMHAGCVNGAVAQILCRPSSTRVDKTPPIAYWIGRYPSIKIDWKGYILEYGQFKLPPLTQGASRQTDVERTHGALRMWPQFNLAGSWAVLDLESWEFRSIVQFIPMRMTSEQAEAINSLVMKHGGPVCTKGSSKAGARDDDWQAPDNDGDSVLSEDNEPNTVSASRDAIIEEKEEEDPHASAKASVDQIPQGNDGHENGQIVTVDELRTPQLGADARESSFHPGADKLHKAMGRHYSDIADELYGESTGDGAAALEFDDEAASTSGDQVEVGEDVPAKPPDKRGRTTSTSTPLSFVPRPTRYNGGFDEMFANLCFSLGTMYTLKQGTDKLGEPAVDAALIEMQQLVDKDVFEAVDAKELTWFDYMRILPSSMKITQKITADNLPDKIKGRLAAGGHKQDRQLYSDEETSAPTISTTSVLMLAGLAARTGEHVVTADIPGAYLNGVMGDKVPVHMRLSKNVAALLIRVKPEWGKWLCKDGSIVVRLKKGLYGCIESAKLWYDTLHTYMNSIGFTACHYDPCLFKRGKGRDLIKIGVYVDDLKFTGHNIAEIRQIVAGLDKEYGKLKVTEGNYHNYLGMTFDYADAGKVKITMTKIIEGILTDYNVTGTAETPAGNDLFKVGDSELAGEADKEKMYSVTYKLLHVAKRARPDLLTATSYLTTRVSKPNLDDMKKLDRVLKYLNGTKELGICIATDPGPISIKAYIDASYAVHDDCRSQTGCIISLGQGPIYTSSSKQKVNTKSSTESEVVGLADKSSQVIWSREILGWLNDQEDGEIPAATVYEDNTAAIQMMKRGRGCSEKTRHIKIQSFFLGDRMANGDINLQHLSTNEMIADFLTKPLQGKLFFKLRDLLLNWRAV